MFKRLKNSKTLKAAFITIIGAWISVYFIPETNEMHLTVSAAIQATYTSILALFIRDGIAK